jgi:nitrite reductase/ring-hydroxylating ferredoxin subunit
MAWRKDKYLNFQRDQIVCHAHGALFDILTGFCIAGPCQGQFLTPASVRIDDGQIVQLTNDMTSLEYRHSAVTDEGAGS